MSWKEVLGRVSFSNCDPIFYGLENSWGILPAPPSWLTGHVIRKDCITAPIPSADYAEYHDQLVLIPDLGIVSRGDVGSVLLFGTRPLESMRDIAIPSDSSTSKKLLCWILDNRGIDPKTIEMGPDISSMLESCDGALLIGDRALSAASSNPETVQLDLGAEWTRITGFPMVFGVFATRKDSPIDVVLRARKDMFEQYSKFKQDEEWRNEVIMATSLNSGLSESRISEYFSREVENILDTEAIKGLELFLHEACGMEAAVEWVRLD